jgi:hypothetical protein
MSATKYQQDGYSHGTSTWETQMRNPHKAREMDACSMKGRASVKREGRGGPTLFFFSGRERKWPLMAAAESTSQPVRMFSFPCVDGFFCVILPHPVISILFHCPQPLCTPGLSPRPPSSVNCKQWRKILPTSAWDAWRRTEITLKEIQPPGPGPLSRTQRGYERSWTHGHLDKKELPSPLSLKGLSEDKVRCWTFSRVWRTDSKAKSVVGQLSWSQAYVLPLPHRPRESRTSWPSFPKILCQVK